MEIQKKKKFREIISVSWQAFRNYRRQIFLVTALGFLGGFIEVVGLNALIPILAFATGNAGGQSDKIIKIIENVFAVFGLHYHLSYLLIFISAVFIIKGIFVVFATYIKFRIKANYELFTRKDLLNKTLNARWTYLLQQKVGYLENVLMNDVHVAGLFLQNMSDFLLSSITLAVYMIAAISISAKMTFMTIGLGVILFFAFKPLIKRKRFFAIGMVKVRKSIAHFVNEHIIGMKIIKSFALIDGVVEKGERLFRRCRDLDLKTTLYSSIATAFIHPISFIYLIILFALLYKTSDFRFAEFVIVVYLINRIFTYIEQLQGNIHKLNDTFPYVESVLHYNSKVIDNKEQLDGKNEFIFQDKIVFDKVRFYYDSGKDILENVSFEIPKGAMVGIIGSSGAGKTTLVDLLLRLLYPSEGRILLDEQDITDISIQVWRGNIGYVSQDIFLFNDTIVNNIKMFNSSLDKQEVIEAMKMADIYDFISACPEGIETVVGERGIKLSVGQRQRIALARILVRRPKLLILDEATSSLDNESERRIQQVIERLKGKTTILIIAHRLSTVLNCDKLFVLEDGKITEEGSPQELLQDKTSYFFKTYNIES